jgi:NAD-dependent DNA ligase
MIEKLVNKITEANQLYRVGKPIMSDNEYDILIEELKSIDPDNDILNSIGFLVKDDDRKRKLSIPMFSMNKIKSMNDVDDWTRLKGISKSEYVIITPKFDGLSLCVNELNSESTTRGDGFHGQVCDEHYKLIDNHLYDVTNVDPFSPIDCQFTYGEVMMSKKTFTEKYSNDFANPRNLVAGLLNSKEATQSLKDCDYIKYGAIFTPDLMKMRYTKQEVIDYLNQYQKVKVQYHVCKISELTEELLISLFKEYSIDYEIDGLIIEINNLSLQYTLGRETSSNNPCYARAFKHPSFEQSAETEIIGISWNISKNGALRPIVHIKPVKLDGVTVSNVTGNNARFIKDSGIGIGSIIRVVRSGMVIPLIKEVIYSVEFEMPNIPNIEWDKRGIDIITKEITEDQKFKQIVAFFEILEADNMGEGNIAILWKNGYKTISDILSISKEDLMDIDGFGDRKSDIILNSIKKSVNNISLPKLQHASNCFVGLGSKKLQLLEHFGYENKPKMDDIIGIDGFAEISANSYLDGFDKFKSFINGLPIVISEIKKNEKTSSEFDGKSFCFTGLRRKDIEMIIESKGGKVSSSVSKNLTYLVAKDINSTSSKLTKASQLGVTLLSIDDLEKMVGIKKLMKF